MKNDGMKPVYAYVPREDHDILDEFHEKAGINKSDFVYMMMHFAKGLGPEFMQRLSDIMLLGGSTALEYQGFKIRENCFVELEKDNGFISVH